MHILIASDKFKGSLSAPEACRAIEAGLREQLPEETHTIEMLPVADGGDGMARALTEAANGEWRTTTVTDPLGEPIEAGYGWLEEERTAVIEMAEASGLALLGERTNDPWSASTSGTGELIAKAMEDGAESILLGIGGSATNDGGTGMAHALGFRFLDRTGTELDDLPAQLDGAITILPPDQPDFPEIIVACDVQNPLLGAEGCTRVYGPQKGIDEADFSRHESRLTQLVLVLGELGETASQLSGAGAAGGLGFGCLAFLRARLEPGFTLVADYLGLPAAIARADLVITGEGKLDAQSLQGKAPCGVAELAREAGKPVVAFCGAKEEGAVRSEFDDIIEIAQPDWPVERNMAEAARLLGQAASRFAAGLKCPPASFRCASQRIRRKQGDARS